MFNIFTQLLSGYFPMQGSFFASFRVKGKACILKLRWLKVCFGFHYFKFGFDRPFIPKQPKTEADTEKPPRRQTKPSAKAAKAKAKSKAKAAKPAKEEKTFPAGGKRTKQ